MCNRLGVVDVDNDMYVWYWKMNWIYEILLLFWMCQIKHLGCAGTQVYGFPWTQPGPYSYGQILLIQVLLCISRHTIGRELGRQRYWSSAHLWQDHSSWADHQQGSFNFSLDAHTSSGPTWTWKGVILWPAAMRCWQGLRHLVSGNRVGDIQMVSWDGTADDTGGYRSQVSEMLMVQVAVDHKCLRFWWYRWLWITCLRCWWYRWMWITRFWGLVRMMRSAG